MKNHPVKYGIDLCPATKNLSQATSCQQCDFHNRDQKECCKCTYFTLIKKAQGLNEYSPIH